MNSSVAITTLAAFAALVLGCSASSSSPSTASTADAGSSTDARASTDAGSSTDAVSDGGACGFDAIGPSEAYTGLNENGELVWAFYGTGAGTELTIENYVQFGGVATPGTVQIKAADESYETCGTCIIFRTGCAGTSCSKTFMPVAGGSIVYTQMGAVGERFTGDFSNVQLREVTIDADTFATTSVSGGQTQCLNGAHFDSALDDIANMP